MSTFVLGTARRIITPPLGTLLYGYPNHRPASAVHDNLNVTVAAIGSDKPTAMNVISLGTDIHPMFRSKAPL